jgi:hypothetical protein
MFNTALIPLGDTEDADILLPYQFAFQQLLNSQEKLKDGRICSDVWKQIHGADLFEDLRAGGDKPNPHGVVIVEPKTRQSRSGIPGRDLSQWNVCQVVSVHEYSGGGARIRDYRDSYKAICKAILWLPDNGIEVRGANGEVIGVVTSTLDLGEVKVAEDYGDRQVVQHGLRYRVTYQFE